VTKLPTGRRLRRLGLTPDGGGIGPGKCTVGMIPRRSEEAPGERTAGRVSSKSDGTAVMTPSLETPLSRQSKENGEQGKAATDNAKDKTDNAGDENKGGGETKPTEARPRQEGV
jgi:hypothetical protein